MGPPAAGMRYRSTAAPKFCLSPNNLIQALAASKHQRLSVRRPGRRIVLEAVVGQAVDLSFQIDRPQVGAFIGVFVALVRVGHQGQGR